MNHEPDHSKEALLEEALALPPERRMAFLDTVCAGNPDLRGELADLIAYATEAEPYFDRLKRASSSVVPRILDVDRSESTAPEDLLPGRKIGHYVLEERLGSGGMGTVYRASDTRLRRPVALKFLAHGLTSDPTARTRFVLEAQAASALENDHICTIHDIGEAPDGRTFMAMAYYDGETLREKIARGPLAVDHAVRYAVQMARGLQAAHRKGIVHRDLKPANVMVTADDTVKLLDFGLVKLAGQTLTGHGRVIGTVAYMSPEQARGDEVDHRTDLWSLGVVLYEMLTADRPFKGDSSEVVLNAIQHREPSPVEHLRPDFPSGLVQIVRRLLEKEPDHRYERAEDVVTALTDVAAHWGAIRDSHPLPAGPERAKDATPGRKLAALLSRVIGMAVLAIRRPEPRRIAVVPFENRTLNAGLDAFGLMAADWVVEGLVGTGLVDVVPMVSILGILSGVSDPETGMIALVRRTGAGTIVLGSFYERDGRLELQAQAMDVRRRKLVGAIQPISAPLSNPSGAVNPLQEAVASLLSKEFEPAGRFLGKIGSRPPAYEAYRALVDSLMAMWRYDYKTAISLCDRAHALDPDFILAHLQAVSILLNIEQFDAADRRLEAAEAGREALGQAEQRAIDLWRTIIDSGPVAGLPGARRQFEQAPTVPSAMVLARIALDANRPSEVVSVLRRFDPRKEHVISLYWYSLVEAHLMRGAPRAALRAARHGRRLLPDDLTVLLSEALALAAIGREDVVLSRVDECLSLVDQHWNRGEVMQMIGIHLLAGGRDEAAEAVFDRSIAWFGSRSHGSESDLQAERAIGRSLAFTHRWSEAIHAFDALAVRFPEDYITTGYRAALALRTGDEERARQVEAELDAIHVPYLPGRATYWKARLAALRGERESAVELLRSAFSRGQGALWTAEGLSFPIRIDPLLAGLRGFEPFESLTRPRG